jgi:acyl-CoA dehydrogenase
VDFTENPDYRLLREAVREICARFPDEYWAGLDESHTFPWEFYDAMAKGGWIGIAIPAEFGGGGCGITEASIVLEEVAASGACMNGASSIHLSIFGMHPVVRHGSVELKQRYLPRIATGDLHVAFGVTEPDAGLDTTAIRTRAVRVKGDGEVGGGYRVTGRKVWTSKALESERVLLLTRTTPIEECAKRTHGLTLFVAALKDPAVGIRLIPKLGRNAVASCEVTYDGLYVDASRPEPEDRPFVTELLIRKVGVHTLVDGEHHGRHGHVDVLALAGTLTLGETGQDGDGSVQA